MLSYFIVYFIYMLILDFFLFVYLFTKIILCYSSCFYYYWDGSMHFFCAVFCIYIIITQKVGIKYTYDKV